MNKFITMALHAFTLYPSLLDLIFINKPQLLKSCSTLPQIADHCPTTVKLSLSGPAPPKPQVFFTWDLENADFKSMKATLSDADWSPVTGCTDVDAAVDRWYSQVLSTAKLSIPRKRHCYRTTSKPWYSPHLHKIAKAKDRLFRRSRGKPADSRIVLAYKKMRNWYVSELRLAELRYFRSIGHRLSTQPDSKSAKNWWSLMKSAAGWSSYHQIPPISDDSGLVHVSAKDRAEVPASTQPLLSNAVHLQLHIHQDSLLLLLHLPSSQSLRSQPSRLFEVSK